MAGRNERGDLFWMADQSVLAVPFALAHCWIALGGRLNAQADHSIEWAGRLIAQDGRTFSLISIGWMTMWFSRGG
jgi:hypothetical protein